MFFYSQTGFNSTLRARASRHNTHIRCASRSIATQSIPWVSCVCVCDLFWIASSVCLCYAGRKEVKREVGMGLNTRIIRGTLVGFKIIFTYISGCRVESEPRIQLNVPKTKNYKPSSFHTWQIRLEWGDRSNLTTTTPTESCPFFSDPFRI